MFVFSTMSKEDGCDQIQMSVKSQDYEAKQALRIAHDLILNALDLRLTYAPSDVLKEHFEVCKQDFVKIWKYETHI